MEVSFHSRGGFSSRTADVQGVGLPLPRTRSCSLHVSSDRHPFRFIRTRLMLLAASSRVLVAALPAGSVVFSFLHILISLVYYSSTSGEVIYGQPWWYDKLIYNGETSALWMRSHVPSSFPPLTAQTLSSTGNEIIGWCCLCSGTMGQGSRLVFDRWLGGCFTHFVLPQSLNVMRMVWELGPVAVYVDLRIGPNLWMNEYITTLDVSLICNRTSILHQELKYKTYT